MQAVEFKKKRKKNATHLKTDDIIQLDCTSGKRIP